VDATGVGPLATKAAPERRKLPNPGPVFSEDSIQFVLEGTREILEGKAFLSTAAHGEQFEKDFAAFCGVSHAMCCSSGTTAIEICLRALDVTGGEVLVPTMTFAATAYAVLHAGARPVFVDCGPDMQIDPDKVAAAIGPDTRAVIAAHMGGYLSRSLPGIAEICRDKGVPFIEDAAQAHGTTLAGKPAGSFGDMAAFSFFSTKVIASGEGGALVTNDASLDERARWIRNQGKDRNTNYHSIVGLHGRLTELQALVLRAQLTEFPAQNAARAAVADVYDARLPGLPGLSLFPKADGLELNYYKYIAFLDRPGCQANLRKMLKEEFGVGLTGFVYELPLHRQPVFAPYAENASCPVADDLARRHICLPAHPAMDTDDAEYVVQALEYCLPRLETPPEEDAPFLLP
jgi:perosamine synthetase